MTINELISKAKELIESMSFDEELHNPESIGLLDVHKELYSILILVDAIRTVQGTDKIYIGQAIKNKEKLNLDIENLKSSLNSIVDKLESTDTKSLTKNEVIREIQDNNQDEDNYYTFIGILSSLDIVTSSGRGRTGGIKKYNKIEDTKHIQDAIEQIAAEQENQEQQSKAKAEKENVLYPSAAKEISSQGYQALIMGVQRRLPGEWNTPDVIGYKINRFKNLGGAEIEIVTIEVKWEISKSAIAEANSHQRLGHKSFLMVHQSFEEIDKSILPDLISKGIGLICKKEEEHKMYIPAKRNNPDKIDIDDFLGQALEQTEIETLKREIARHFYSDYLKPILPN